MKSLLKALMARTPYRIVRGAPSNRFQAIETVINALATHGFDPGVVIDGGANVGHFTREMLTTFPRAVVHAIEPQPGCAAALDALKREHDARVVVHKVALCAPEDAGTTLDIAGDAGSTSTGAYIVPKGESADSMTGVPCATLDSLFVPPLRTEDRALLKLDLQGYELHALKGATQTLAAVEFVLSEVSFFRQAYEPPIETLVAFLSDHGFELYDIASVAGRTRDNRARHGDFLFVRRDSPLARDTRWA